MMERLRTLLEVGRYYSRGQVAEVLGREGDAFLESVGDIEPIGKFLWIELLHRYLRKIGAIVNCFNCGVEHSNNYYYHNLCYECSRDVHKKAIKLQCAECDATGTSDKMYYVSSHDCFICQDCYENFAFTCGNCHEIAFSDDGVYIDEIEDIICYSCYEDSDYASCNLCGRAFNINHLNRNFLCNNCVYEEDDEDDYDYVEFENS